MVKKNCDDTLNRFHLIPECNGQTDGHTDRFAILISRVSVLTRDKNVTVIIKFARLTHTATLVKVHQRGQ